MEMTLRWYGSSFDTVTLKQIRQIPGVTGVITTLYDTAPGEVWSRERIHAMKEEVEANGLHVSGIESVNVHDAIKIGNKDRDLYINNYIETLENLGKEDIHLVCYNFMPVFDWTRTELARKRPDGSTVLAYTQAAVDALNPEDMFHSIASDTNGSIMPGWEPERMAHIKELFEMYKDVDDEKLFANLKYFLERIMPVCDKYDINMAIHPDDPAWSVFGLPRIIINKKNILRMMKMVDNPHNGVTFCSGSYGTNLENDLPDMIRSLKGRIHFAHVRNLKFNSPSDFEEAAHLSSDGSFDMYEIMKALYDIDFQGPIRPDHGRMIWDEVAMPGYGLYDRASYNRLKEIFGNGSLQLASFTITEKGYSLNDSQGLPLPDVLADFTGGQKTPVSCMGKVAALLYHRFTKGGLPIAMVSMDNCSHNGDKLKTAITAFAEKWVENNLVEPEFLTYVTSNKVSFPWTMIDKITPRPNTSVEELLKKDGVQDLDPVITGKHTYVAPFVNSEECEYLVIEDVFPNGRPALEKSGFIFTDRETVDKVERMKVCTCLNPLHTALAVFGCLLDYKLIAEEMKDSTLKTLVERLGYQEGLPVVMDPGILNPKEFLDTVLGIRIPNPFMPDTPQRIATDTSQKLSIRYGETIKAYEKSSTLQTSDLKMIPLVFAGWLRNGIRNWQKKKNRLDFWYCPLSVLEMHSTLKREDFLTTYLC